MSQETKPADVAVKAETTGGLAVLTLNRPGAYNALSLALGGDELLRALNSSAGRSLLAGGLPTSTKVSTPSSTSGRQCFGAAERRQSGESKKF